jgi:alanyl-tRNA synthetase
MTLQWRSVEEIRRVFLEYFLKKDHRLIEPAGILPHDDPTLMFINSGMAPMKPFFTGQSQPPYPRLTNVQDCIRFVDVEDVGDSHHGTSFRMLGSWSFGDYFKERAIELAFELLTEIFRFPAAQLYATVFVSDETTPAIPDDEESARIWERYLPRERIVSKPPEDNFWGPAGATGPCGPCTEVFFDRGEQYGQVGGDDPLIPERHVEIWNAGVFMQYFKDEQGNFSVLPMNCVDTGAGLERLAMILQDRVSIHEIDQYEEVYRSIEQVVSDTTWTRIILDHLKTALLLMREGIVPSNQREGYMLRRTLRRSMSGVFLRDINLSVVSEWFESLCEVVDNKGKTDAARPTMLSWLEEERNSFELLMRRSRKHLDKIAATQHLDAKQAFDLKTSLGIPEDLLEEYCRRYGIEFPRKGYLQLFREHQEISRGKTV